MRKVWEYGNAIRNEIKDFDWLTVLRNQSIDEMVEIFTNKVLLVAEINIPSKYITVNDKECPWVTDSVRAAINRNKRVYKLWLKRGKSPSRKHHVNAVQNETNKIIKEAKKTNVDKICGKICGRKEAEGRSSGVLIND